MEAPSFAVVGRPNKGKSSIVATLARDDSVHIAPEAGSTRRARRFPMRIDGEVLYELVDTPGMQRARAVLAWLQDNCSDASERPATVRRFLQEHLEDSQYRDECQALAPIVEGAGIIYVVDGSHPFGADYEAEMEILRWTGRPSLALINPIGSADYVEQWSAGLGQYFQTVRVFDAHRAEHRKQLELLELFGHLDPDYRDPVERAVQVLEADRQLQHRNVALLIADLIHDGLTYRTEQSIPEGAPEQPVQKLLYSAYRRHLVRREQQCREQVEELYSYTEIESSEGQIELDQEELFNEESWYLWGLSRRQLLIAAASAGGLAGGGAGMVLDGATGGLLGGLGTAISGIGGAAASAVGAVKYADEIAQFRVKGVPTGGKLLSVGPSRNPNFPFVLLGRAMQHQRALCQRTHAVRERLELDRPLLDWLADADRRSLARLFDDLRKGRKVAQRRTELADQLEAWCSAADGGKS